MVLLGYCSFSVLLSGLVACRIALHLRYTASRINVLPPEPSPVRRITPDNVASLRCTASAPYNNNNASRPSNSLQRRTFPYRLYLPLSHSDNMRPSTVLLCLAPTVALATQQPSAVQPSPSVPNVTPPVPLPELQQHQFQYQQSPESVQEAGVDAAAPQPTDAFDLGKATSTKSMQARSEGTLGQSPWIGMAIGLTCTAFAAVMLG